MSINPDYIKLGYSSKMGPLLRKVVEEHLLDDLSNYGINPTGVKFDWSDSLIEGHDATYLDGHVENFSGILLFDENDNILAEGWMEFIHEPDYFVAYWDYLEILDSTTKGKSKTEFGMPSHVFEKIPEHLKWRYERAKR